MPVQRLSATQTPEVLLDGETCQGNFKRVYVESFPKGVAKLRLYARAWGRRNGDPGNEPSGFFDKLIRDANKFADEVFPFTTKSKDRPGFQSPPRAQAYMDVWVNGEVLKPSFLKPSFKPLYDQQFDNYNLYFEDEDWPVPSPGVPFEYVVSHGNNIADCDGFEVFAELTTNE